MQRERITNDGGTAQLGLYTVSARAVLGLSAVVLSALALTHSSTRALADDAASSHVLGVASGTTGISEKTLGPSLAYLPAERYQRFVAGGDAFNREEARQWAILVELLQYQSTRNKLKLVQKFFTTLPYRTDIDLFGVEDYWASAGEVMRRGGDCEDHALAKYRLLVDAGVPADDMKVVLAQVTSTGEEHAYLLVETEDGNFVLDNRIEDVVTEIYITNYRPLYAVNQYTVWSYSINPAQFGPATDEILPAAE